MKSLTLLGLAGLVTLTSLGAMQAANALPASKLTVTLNGLRSQRGRVCLSLFANSQGFPDRNGKAVQARCVDVSSTPVVVTFNNLQLGTYAIATFHDENGDGKLNRNGLGIPTEGFGFSRNPQIVAGPPRFGESAVLVAGAETDIQIRFQYLLGG